MGGVPGDASSLGMEPGSVTALFPEPANDNERLESLIARTSVSLLELSVEQIYSAHTHDDAALRDQATGMCSLASGARADAVSLEVSPEAMSAYLDFIAALDEFVAAGALIDGNNVFLNQSVMDETMGHLALGTGHLSDAMQGFNNSPSAGSSNTEPVPTFLAAESVPALPDALQIGERFCYDDARGENSASLIVGTIKRLHTFQTGDPKPKKYTAKPGESFLLVAVKVTHLGHKGDGTNARLRSPGENIFTLHYLGETYRPMRPPGPTNQGGSYSGCILDRHESAEGFLFFEVSESLDPSYAYLQANIGGGRPVWLLSEDTAP